MLFKPTNIVWILLACLCFYGGSGFYLSQFCCSNCQDFGVEAALSDECHKIHKADNQSCCSTSHSKPEHSKHQDNSSCSDNEKHCSITSYKFDLNSYNHNIQIDVPVIDLPFIFLYTLDEVAALKSQQYNLQAYILPVYSSRDILAHHSTLLI